MSFESLKKIVGVKGWTSDVDRLQPHLTEWRGTWQGKTPLMLLPSDTEEVAALVRECARLRIAIVPQGGNTGLCGGAIPDASGTQVLLSLSRMNRIRSLNADNFSMVAEAGCVLSNLQDAARQARRLFPLSLAAEGSCQIGGNLATNAGGVNVLRYGSARDQVLGLEVVLPDGQVIHGLRELRKDNAGYDLKHLFVGSEGTLGIITAAALRLYPVVDQVTAAFIAVESPRQAIELFGFLRQQCQDRLQAFELISQRAADMVFKHQSGTRNPFDRPSPWYLLIDAADPPESGSTERALVRALDSGLATNAVIAKSDSEREALWRIRHGISEAQKHEGASIKHDVSVPVDAIDRFIEQATAAVEAICDGARVVPFGHVGDGNVHFNVSQPAAGEAQAFLGRQAEISAVVYRIVAQLGGSFSAEHGIGVLKKNELKAYRSRVEIELMTALKMQLDPHNIMNPGKVL